MKAGPAFGNGECLTFHSYGLLRHVLAVEFENGRIIKICRKHDAETIRNGCAHAGPAFGNGECLTFHSYGLLRHVLAVEFENGRIIKIYRKLDAENNPQWLRSCWTGFWQWECLPCLTFTSYGLFRRWLPVEIENCRIIKICRKHDAENNPQWLRSCWPVFFDGD